MLIVYLKAIKQKKARMNGVERTRVAVRYAIPHVKRIMAANLVLVAVSAE